MAEKFCKCIELEVFGYFKGGLGVAFNVLTIIGLALEGEKVFPNYFVPWIISNQVISIFASFPWIYGIYKKKHLFMLPLVIFDTIYVTIFFTTVSYYIIYGVVIYYIYVPNNKISTNVIALIIISISVAIIYFTFHVYMCILELYKKITYEENFQNRNQIKKVEKTPV
ncbi:hypothetical protein PVAND_008957 [Polypedilum vanderplanki]|uniref:Uncharacterized protein n=1 Tax=Polypedilum vanderplanki TaxID=319348 RepID=A0A9J6CBT8_POLVA|nr:hypothetical protein PVAND_008957 [Polypedilum vanderplanki]